MIGGSSHGFSRMTSPHSILMLVNVTCFLSSSKHPGVGRSSGLPCCWPFLSASSHYLEGVKVEYSPAPTGKRKGPALSISYKDNEMIFSSLNDLPVEIKGVCVWCGDKEEVVAELAKPNSNDDWNIFKGCGELSSTDCFFFFFPNVKIIKFLCLQFWVSYMCNRKSALSIPLQEHHLSIKIPCEKIDIISLIHPELSTSDQQI